MVCLLDALRRAPVTSLLTLSPCNRLMSKRGPFRCGYETHCPPPPGLAHRPNVAERVDDPC